MADRWGKVETVTDFIFLGLQKSMCYQIVVLDKTLESPLDSTEIKDAAWGASFPSERALPAGGFGSVHTPSP